MATTNRSAQKKTAFRGNRRVKVKLVLSMLWLLLEVVMVLSEAHFVSWRGYHHPHRTGDNT